jgi:hypothetical protein
MRGTRQNLPFCYQGYRKMPWTLQIAYKLLKKNTNLTNPGLA